MKKIMLLLAVTLFSISCEELKKNPEVAKQMQQVMSIHDGVMPQMATVGKLMDELKGKAGIPGNGPSYEAAIKDLQASNTAMMEWMQNFSQRFDPQEILNAQSLSTQKQSWLNEEEKSIKAIRDQINTSIAKAQSLLNTK